MNGAVAESASRDLREGGTWTRAQRVKNALLAVAIRAALALLVPLPPRVLGIVGRMVGRLALHLFPRARAVASENLTRAFPELDPLRRRALLRAVYDTLGAHLGDALASLDARRTFVPLPIDPSSLALLTRPEGGVVFASAHLGPWERVAASLAHHSVPLTALARETYDPRLSHVYDRLRASRGVKAIYRGHPGAAARIVRTLRDGGVLGIPMDLQSRVPSIEAPFLGRHARTPRGPARIALRTGAAVVVGTVAPMGGPCGEEHPHALRITCTAIPTDDLPDDASGEQILTTRINAELSARILALPAHWVWMHDRFAGGDPVD